MSGFINLILRGIALLWTLLITALIGNVIALDRDAAMSAKSAINFTMFVAVLSWIVCIYGMLSTFISALGRPLIMLPLDSLGVLFTFISAIVLSAKLRATNCGNISNLDLPGSWIGFGSDNDEKRCREIQASAVFMWFLWACLCGGFFFTFKESRSPFGSSLRSSRPAMSQV
ncbi:hypothetical protein K4F52_004574 [Lecanicillium sp. MT-2017a]|nr:hypothetical protein K4F52_004574 [Lecanicillium sp. MT-2017a]